MGRTTQDDVVAALHRIAFLLERRQESEYRSKAYRGAGDTLRELDDEAWTRHARAGDWSTLPGIGASTAGVIATVLAGDDPEKLTTLERERTAALADVTPEGERLREAVRGDLHSHTLASDGGASLSDMALTALDLGHGYLAVTDHSPRLTVANGLSPQRLRAQIGQVEAMNTVLEPQGFRLLAGIEVDVLDDGALDQTPELLARLDVVVASVHSKLRMERAAMTRRMVAAVEGGEADVLGHCTGRRVRGRARPPSEFDARAVFEACAAQRVAVEVNCRPDRQDPPDDLLDLAVEVGCLFSVDSDAHAPGQLDWLVDGCERLAARGVGPDRVVTTWPVDDLLAWTAGRRGR
ncbi:PHP domain-containing protein [Cellulomonas sp. APG4]|uniref:PHP domain-containing protein n=1 Tax=Cellulomonas sp. APG4 TaxID=1538656 RepID=UPI00137A5926|nr:PHP domain-containing protein [Cellulomonas sp. APG4]